MTKAAKQPLKVAILDLYGGTANDGIRGFEQILKLYKTWNNLDLSYEVFDVRKKLEAPGLNFDVYISSGGPGNPIDSEGSAWENKYWGVIDKLEDHNLSNTAQKKFGLFVCHSFQLMCRKYQLGDINLRGLASYGVLPVYKTEEAANEPVFEGLADPFYAVDSRLWQVINPNENKFTKLGVRLMAVEKERPDANLPRAMMAIRFNEYFFATQFHPEAYVDGVKAVLLKDEKKKEVSTEHGVDTYAQMLKELQHPDKLTLTKNTMIPNFLDQVILSLRKV